MAHQGLFSGKTKMSDKEKAELVDALIVASDRIFHETKQDGRMWISFVDTPKNRATIERVFKVKVAELPWVEYDESEFKPDPKRGVPGK